MTLLIALIKLCSDSNQYTESTYGKIFNIIIKENIFAKFLSLFTTYPRQSIILGVVKKFIVWVLNSEQKKLISSLFDDGGILEWLFELNKYKSLEEFRKAQPNETDVQTIGYKLQIAKEMNNLSCSEQIITDKLDEQVEKWDVLEDNFMEPNKDQHAHVLGGEHPRDMFKPKRKLPKRWLKKQQSQSTKNLMKGFGIRNSCPPKYVSKSKSKSDIAQRKRALTTKITKKEDL